MTDDKDIILKNCLKFIVGEALDKCGIKEDAVLSGEDADKVLTEIGRVTYILFDKLVLQPELKARGMSEEVKTDGSDSI